MAKYKGPNKDGLFSNDEEASQADMIAGSKAKAAEEPKKTSRKRKPSAKDLGIRKREAVRPRTVYLDDEEIAAIARMAVDLGCSKSDVIRACIRKTLNFDEIEIETRKREEQETAE